MFSCLLATDHGVTIHRIFQECKYKWWVFAVLSLYAQCIWTVIFYFVSLQSLILIRTVNSLYDKNVSGLKRIVISWVLYLIIIVLITESRIWSWNKNTAEVTTILKTTVLWDVIQCSKGEKYWYFAVTCCLRYH
jgi:hypothetical protein